MRPRLLGPLRLAISLLAVTGAGALVGCNGSEPERPNVLIVVTDDQGRGLDVMPATNRLFADQGIRFTNAFTTTPLCCPSRASIFSGLYAHNHGVHDNFQGENLDQSETLQSLLQAEGYRTGLFGKFLNHWDVERPPSFFDRWAMYPAPSNATYYRGGSWNVDGNVRTIQSYATTFINEQTTRFLREGEDDDDQPWLAVVTTTAPHFPSTPESQYVNASVPSWSGNPAVAESRRADKPDYVLSVDCDLACAKPRREEQLRTLLSVDDLVSDLFSSLDELGESDETLAIFMSDNGRMWGEHGIGGKRTPYLQSVQVPMLLRWPDRVSAGVDDRLVANVDVAPTIVDAVGLEDEAPPMDGNSLLDSSWARDRLLIEYWSEGKGQRSGESFVLPPTWRSIVTPSRHYTEYYGTGGRVTDRELYDLDEDPWELRNLMHSDRRSPRGPDSAEITRLERWLRRAFTCHGDDCP